MKFHKINIVLIIVYLFSAEIIFGQTKSVVSIISTNVIYLRTDTVKSSNRHVPGSKYVQPAVTYYKNDYYLLKFSIKLNDNIESPLELKLSPDKRTPRVFRIENNLGDLGTNTIYDYELEYGLNDKGWVKFEVGNFSEFENHNNFDQIFDKTLIYIRK